MVSEHCSEVTMKTNLNYVSVVLVLSVCLHCSPIDIGAHTRGELNSINRIESAAKLLINLDESIEIFLQDEPTLTNHFYIGQTEISITNNSQSENEDREEKFSVILQDLSKIEDQIKEAISKANLNRQYRLVMRLRPLLSYVNHIHRNMEILRTRVVTIATLSNIAMTANEMVDQFADVMTSSLGLSTGIVHHKDKLSTVVSNSITKLNETFNVSTRPMQTTIHSNLAPEVTTTLSYTEEDSENFLKNIINQERK